MTDREHLPYRPCAGIVLMNREGLIFTGERIDTPGAWQMPQGGIDEGESNQAAALRELEEEISVKPTDVEVVRATQDWVLYDLPDDLLGKVWKGQFRGQKQYWVLLKLLANDSVINIQTAEPEFGRWRWASPEQVIRDIVPFKREVYQQVLSELL